MAMGIRFKAKNAQNVMISQDPEVQIVLNLMADKLRARKKEDLAFKIENLIDLLTDELQAQVKKKS